MVQQAAAAKWRALVARQEASGQTIKAFAESEGVNAGTLTWWRWRLRRADRVAVSEAGATFAEVAVVEPDQEPTVVLVFDDLPVHLVVDRNTDLALLRDVLASLC